MTVLAYELVVFISTRSKQQEPTSHCNNDNAASQLHASCLATICLVPTTAVANKQDLHCPLPNLQAFLVYPFSGSQLKLVIAIKNLQSRNF